MKLKKVVAGILACALVIGCLAGCGNNEPAPAPTPSAGQEQGGAAGGEEGALTYVDLSGQDIVVGVSTGSAGTSWRDQGVKNLTAALDEYVAAGVVKDYKIVHNTTNGDANEQAQIIRNFIDDPAVNVILVNPNDATALNEAMEDALAAGKLVVAFDATVTAKGVLNVTLDHYTYAYEPTKILVDIMGGEGPVVEISGLDGHPADVVRIDATADALAEYANVELLANQPGGWDNTTAKSVMASYLSSGMEPVGVISQDSECYGILQACLDADYLPKVMSGDSTKAYFIAWKELVDAGEDFDSVVAPNPPGIAVSGLRLAIGMAQGKTFKDGVLEDGNVYYYKVAKFYTNENFEEGWEKVQQLSDEECLDEWLSQEDADACFN